MEFVSPAAYGYFAAQLLLLTQELALGLLRQVDYLLRAAAQQHTVVREDDAVLAAAKQLHAQLLLKLDELPRQRRLRDVQQLRRARDVLLAGHD